MKKTTLLRWHNVFMLLLFLTYSFGSAQCIRTAEFGTPVSNNSGNPQNVTTCAYGTEYSTISNLLIGGDYTFNATLGTTPGSGTPVFITITDTSNNVLIYGMSPLQIDDITVTTVRMHYAEDATCAGNSVCHSGQFQYLPTCSAPTGVTASNVTDSTALLEWTASVSSPSDGYEYYYSTSSTAPTAATTPMGSVGAGTTSVDLLGLSGSSIYYAWVRSVCSGTDTSIWSNVYSFTTVCDVVTEFTENFDAGLILPACWARVGTGGNAYVQANTGTPSAPNNLYIYGTSATNQGVVAMRPVSNAGDGTHRLRFKAKGNFTAGDTLEVGYLTDPSDATSFVSVQEFTMASSTVYSTYNVDMGTAPGSNQVLAFRHKGVIGYSIVIDDVNWEVTPTCLEPTAVVSSNVGTNTATVAWTASASAPADGYEYYYNTTNTAPTASTTATGSVGAGEVFVDLIGLSSATSYYVWVRSVCSGTETSVWSESTSFVTLCDPVTEFTENFDASLAFPVCWAKVGPGGLANVQANTGTPSTPNNLYIYGTSSTDQGVVAMRPVSNAGDGTHRLRFKAKGNFTAGDTLEVGYLVDPTDASTFVSVQEFTTTSNTVYSSYTVEMGTAPGASQVLAFRHKGVIGYSIVIDDVNWEMIPTCIEPTDLLADNISQNAATIYWTESVTPPADGYEYYYSTSSTEPTAATTASGSVGAGVLSADLTGLDASSVYYFWVRSVCSSTETSMWSVGASFSTLCAPATTPYTVDFESAVVPAVPLCTSTQNAGLGNNWVVVNNPGYGFTSKTLRYGYNSTNDANAWFFTNAVTLTGGTSYRITYRYGNNDTTTYTENLAVYYGDSPVDTSMSTQLADHFGINQGTAQNGLVEFTPSVSGDYYFGFNAYSFADQWNLMVDDIAIVENLATPGFESNKFTFYPNPVKDVLNIGYTKAIAKVSVYNILGQEVLTKNSNADQSQINMSNLSAGTYLVKVTAEDGAVKTIKVVKQ